MVEFAPTLKPTEAEIEAVVGVIAGNEIGNGRDAGYQPFGILLRGTPDGEVIGGLTGYQLFEWLFVQYLGVPESLRGQGIGRDLMQRAEAWARGRGLVGLWLDTFAFQAVPFYEKLGYSVFGTIEDHPRGSRRHFMLKRLD